MRDYATSDLSAQHAAQLRILSETRFFDGLSPAQLQPVASVSRLEEHARGYPIYRIGETARTLYVLNDGMVQFAISFGDRAASAGDILRRGQVFGWAALAAASNVRIATATCMTPCSLLAIDGPGLLDLMEEDHTLGYRLMAQLNILITGTLTAFIGG